MWIWIRLDLLNTNRPHKMVLDKIKGPVCEI